MYSRKHIVLIGLLFLVYIINGIIAIPKLSITFDEGDHLNYGTRIVRGHSEKIRPFDDASTMPISALNTIPRIVEQLINPSLRKTDSGISDLYAGRYITLFFSVFIGLFILKWSREMYGPVAGLFSLFLFVFCPDLAGHSLLVTTDSFCALLALTTTYYFWRLTQHGSWKNVFLFSSSLAVAQLTKQSLTHLLIIFSFLSIVYIFLKRKSIFKQKFFYLKIFISVLILLFIINLGFLFKGTGASLSYYQFHSNLFIRFGGLFQPFYHIPLPFPTPYIEGLDMVKHMDEMGLGRSETAGYSYLFGNYSADGFWYYYFVVIFFKTPLSILFCSFIFSLFWLRKKQTRFSGEFILLFVIGYLLLYFNFFYNNQVGVRYVLMLFPLWIVLLGRTAEWVFSHKMVAVSIGLYTLATFYYYFPNVLAYSNEFLIPKRYVYKVMSNTNENYGQSEFFISSYLSAHPEVKRAPLNYQTGKFVISVSEYLDLYKTGDFTWLRKYEPIGQVSHSYLLFEIK
ncbi:MAG: glycosyltransferase family 39 protein [Chitinophagaceae bacterium]